MSLQSDSKGIRPERATIDPDPSDSGPKSGRARPSPRFNRGGQLSPASRGDVAACIVWNPWRTKLQCNGGGASHGCRLRFMTHCAAPPEEALTRAMQGDHDLDTTHTCCIAGGGPAGLMLGLLLARA